MNPILEAKIDELEKARDYECWYLVKQPTAFDFLCYLVSFLKKYKSNPDASVSLQTFISNQINHLRDSKPEIKISDNYRALRVAAFFGLIRMNNPTYINADITETFDEITSRCNGDYEKTELYTDIIQRQIEKMYISSDIDEEYNGIRKNYRLYPVMLLYKILIERGHSTGNYSITMTDYRYLVATTKKYEDFLETLLLIKLMHEDSSAAAEFEKYRLKFDNRLIQALKQLPTIDVATDSITLKNDHIDEVAEKVYVFESNPDKFTAENYSQFLGSTDSLFQAYEPVNDSQSKAPDALGQAFSKHNPNIAEDEAEETGLDEVAAERVKGGTNIILYGVPGAGKSRTIKHEYCDDESRIERLVFHPDYTYSDFVGQILPIVSEDGNVSYKFSAGPFTKLVRKAYINPDKMYYLIIEEVNRGNAPAIFGDVFQLLDRDKDGNSEYKITNSDIAKIVYRNGNHMVSIPSNMCILCTMNTSDQNVFTLDTAFQRRWSMRLIKNKFHNTAEEQRFADTKILDTDVTWKKFFTEINSLILNKNIRMTSSEDKRLGTHFVLEKDLAMGDGNERQVSRFPEKVLKYLWDDAFKFTKEDIFDLEKVKSLEDVIDLFVTSTGNDRFRVFKENIYSSLVPKSNA